MALKNYTTDIPAEKSIAEIEKNLAANGVNRVMKEYGPTGKVERLTFSIKIVDRDLPFQLPAKVSRVLEMLHVQRAEAQRKRQRHLPQANESQAERTAWRILRDWVDAQMALVQIGQATLPEVFLPYLYDMEKAETLYERLQRTKFNGFLLEAPRHS